MVRPDILFLSPVVPCADGSGIERRAWAHVEAMARYADVSLVVAGNPGEAPQGAARALARTMHILPLEQTAKMRRPALPGLAILNRLARLRASPVRAATAELEALAEAFRGRRFDHVFCFRIQSFRVWEDLRRAAGMTAGRLLVDFDDIESLAIAREIPHQKAVVGREETMLAQVLVLETRLLERRILKVADAVIVCSAVDRARLQARGGRAALHVIPNSVPTVAALPQRPVGGVAEILFLGTMAYPPNEDAILYFCERVLPRLRRGFGRGVHLNVVGFRPGPRVLALARDPAITVTGGVESVAPWYATADLVIAPIRFGGGTRIKILEALSYGRAVVATSFAAEGLDLRPDQDILFADGDGAFADACAALLQDDARRFCLASSGCARVGGIYTRPAVQRGLAGLLFGAAAGQGFETSAVI